jgi:Endoplasmic reticulum protein ERp29, C-terminal domain
MLHQHVQVGHKASIPTLMSAVDKFMMSMEGQEAALADAQAIVPRLTPAEAAAGVWYLKTMKHIMWKGDQYLQDECDLLPSMHCTVTSLPDRTAGLRTVLSTSGHASSVVQGDDNFNHSCAQKLAKRDDIEIQA